MKSKNNKAAAESALKMIPAKWAIAIVVALIAYVLIQPQLNQRFGWKLPSLAGMLGEEKGASKERESKDPVERKVEKINRGDSTSKTNAPHPSDSPDADETTRSKSSNSTKPKSNDTKTQSSDLTKEESKRGQNQDTAGSSVKSKPLDEPKPKKEFLKEIGRDRFESPAGLVYGPGSEEGHRLKHVERHIKDIPNRPGSHGVFEGTMDEFLEAIDDAVTRAKRGNKGTTKKEDDGAIVYEASFDKAIGYLGGQEGKRRKNPKLKKIRVVVRGNSVITAFPF